MLRGVFAIAILVLHLACSNALAVSYRNPLLLRARPIGANLQSTSLAFDGSRGAHSSSMALQALRSDADGERGVFSKVAAFSRRTAASLVIVLSMLTSLVLPARARSGPADGASGTLSSSSRVRGRRGDRAGREARLVARVELEVEEGEELDNRDKQLTRVGLMFVALSTLYILIPSGKGKKGRGSSENRDDAEEAEEEVIPPMRSPAKSAKKPPAKKNSKQEEQEDEDLFGEVEGGARIASRNNVLGRGGLGRDSSNVSKMLRGSQEQLMGLPEPDDLFSNGESADDVFAEVETPAQRRAARQREAEEKEEREERPVPEEEPSVSVSSLGRGRVNKFKSAPEPANSAGGDDKSLDSLLPPYASIIAAPVDSQLPTPSAPSRAAAPEPEEEPYEAEESVPAKKGNILDRLFQKPGGGRPADIKSALKVGSGDPSEDYRVLVAAALTAYVPDGALPNKELGRQVVALTQAGSVSEKAEDEKERMQALKDEIQASGLSEQEAGEVFAEVANALLVSLVDSAAKTADGKEEQLSVEALDLVTDFVQGAGALFGSTTPRARIDPIQYNGKARKGKLETLYMRYAKAGMDLKSIMGAMGGGGGEEEGGAEEGEAAMSPEERADRLGKLQFLFNIKEGKRNGMEQKIMREMMMSMTKEMGGEGGDLGKMMEAFSGKGGADMAGMEEMMGQMGQGGAGGFPGGGGGPDGIPDMSNMNPEDVAAMSKEAMGAVKQALAEGSLGRNDVLEFEKMIGMDVKKMVGMMESGKVDKRQLQKLSPDLAEMMDVFRQLAAIKG
ncbi:hypothetical protein B484DRAFT_444090 [Ochromonadaceae sp. CCMP2298]|nr:hypothetical protein B484DRAFT_444090 [Ochromonadaceae sp. CCMP2298]